MMTIMLTMMIMMMLMITHNRNIGAHMQLWWGCFNHAAVAISASSQCTS